MLFGKLYKIFLTRNGFEGFENLVNILGIQIFYETTWNFKLNVIYELFMFHSCCDMWLPGDYLARYYSLCDIGILAPIFVMVIEIHLCDNNEFRLCDNILFPSLQWHI